MALAYEPEGRVRITPGAPQNQRFRLGRARNSPPTSRARSTFLIQHAAEALVLRIEDFEGNQLRIDEALKERQSGEERIGDTKTDESDNFAPVPPDLQTEMEVWIRSHPEPQNPRAFLFPKARGGAFGVGNDLKRHLKPLGEEVGIHDLTHKVFRRTSFLAKT